MPSNAGGARNPIGAYAGMGGDAAGANRGFSAQSEKNLELGPYPPATERLGWLLDADDTRTQAALSRSCDVCGVKRGDWCRNQINPNQPLPGRLIHHARTQPRGKENTSDK